MDFAVLGYDPEVLAVAEFLQQSREHRVTSFCCAAPMEQELARRLPGVPFRPDWEALLVQQHGLVVLVGREGHQDSLPERLRVLTQEAVPVVLSHPLCGALMAYEIDMIQRDVGGIVVPYYPGRSHPLLHALRDTHRSGSGLVGTIEQVSIDRRVEFDERRQVIELLTRDVSLVREFLGSVAAVSATSVDPQQDRITSLNAMLTMSDGSVVQWSLRHGKPAAMMSLRGQAGHTQLNLSEPPESWNLQDLMETPDDWSSSQGLLNDLQGTLDGEPRGANWQDACHDLEVVDSVELSLRKKKTIDVRTEEHTEEGSFKGVMAAGSCGLLLLAMLILIGSAIIDGFRMQGIEAPSDTESAASSWPLVLRFWPAYPFLLFLALQLLLLVAKKSGNSSSDNVNQ